MQENIVRIFDITFVILKLTKYTHIYTVKLNKNCNINNFGKCRLGIVIFRRYEINVTKLL